MAHGTYDTIKKWMNSGPIREMIQASLGKGIEVDGWINGALASIGLDKDALTASPESVLGAFIEAASLGVRFEGPLGEAYITTRNRKGTGPNGEEITITEAQLLIGYRGLMKLARRDPRVRKVEAIIIHEHDIFEHQLGSDQYLHHTWDVGKPRGAMVAVYAAVRYHDGFYDFGQPYPMTAVLRHRARILADKYIIVEADDEGKEHFYKVFRNGDRKELENWQIKHIPWITYLEAMTQATAVRWSAKFWDLAPDFDRATALISIAESDRSQELEAIAKRLIPAEDPSPDSKGTKRNEGVQFSSLMRQGSLKERMLQEAGQQSAGQGANEGPPSEDRVPPQIPSESPEAERGEAEVVVQEGEQGDGGSNEQLTEEEKAEILRMEQEEAAQVLAEQEELIKDSVVIPTSTGKGRGRNKG